MDKEKCLIFRKKKFRTPRSNRSDKDVVSLSTGSSVTSRGSTPPGRCENTLEDPTDSVNRAASTVEVVKRTLPKYQYSRVRHSFISFLVNHKYASNLNFGYQHICQYNKLITNIISVYPDIVWHLGIVQVPTLPQCGFPFRIAFSWH